MACMDNVPVRQAPLTIRLQPVLLVLAGLALGFVIAMASGVPEVVGPEDWHGNVRVSGQG